MENPAARARATLPPILSRRLFLPYHIVFSRSHTSPGRRVAKPDVLRGARARARVGEEAGWLCAGSQVEYRRRSPPPEGRSVVGRRSNARSNQRRMDHPLLSAWSQPPSQADKLLHPLQRHSGTKSSRSPYQQSAAGLCLFPVPAAPRAPSVAVGGAKVKVSLYTTA